eukprot:30991-Pelagococcus_subviridis.AAC.14
MQQLGDARVQLEQHRRRGVAAVVRVVARGVHRASPGVVDVPRREVIPRRRGRRASGSITSRRRRDDVRYHHPFHGHRRRSLQTTAVVHAPGDDHAARRGDRRSAGCAASCTAAVRNRGGVRRLVKVIARGNSAQVAVRARPQVQDAAGGRAREQRPRGVPRDVIPFRRRLRFRFRSFVVVVAVVARARLGLLPRRRLDDQRDVRARATSDERRADERRRKDAARGANRRCRVTTEGRNDERTRTSTAVDRSTRRTGVDADGAVVERDGDDRRRARGIQRVQRPGRGPRDVGRRARAVGRAERRAKIHGGSAHRSSRPRVVFSRSPPRGKPRARTRDASARFSLDDTRSGATPRASRASPRAPRDGNDEE